MQGSIYPGIDRGAIGKFVQPLARKNWSAPIEDVKPQRERQPAVREDGEAPPDLGEAGAFEHDLAEGVGDLRQGQGLDEGLHLVGEAFR